jgi:membrane protein implicated in regulation of membrane protease activity
VQHIRRLTLLIFFAALLFVSGPYWTVLLWPLPYAIPVVVVAGLLFWIVRRTAAAIKRGRRPDTKAQTAPGNG